MADWDNFDSTGYADRNYGRGILSEDLQIMRFVVAELRALRLSEESLESTADVGAGPNLYPSLLLAPYIAADGTLELIDRSASNIRYLNRVVKEAGLEDPNTWSKFERCLRDLDHPTSVRKLRDVTEVRMGSIFELSAARYDAVMCFFVAESITSDSGVFATSLDRLMRSLKPGGVFVTAHMVGSTGYRAGPKEPYPACDLSMREIEESYEPYGTFRALLTSPSEREAVRPGYRGMAALVGRRERCTTPSVLGHNTREPRKEVQWTH
ncbi:hypothetical protein ACFW5W_33225 [Streptomyces sp. NPDC058783]|uniref:hypothetical protein n=1 Tax=Streptomyces sp. NPDC058783 TaxID=3346633 RepID=UPI00367F3605